MQPSELIYLLLSSPNATSSTGPTAISSTATSSGPTGDSSSSTNSTGLRKNNKTPVIVGAVIGSLAALRLLSGVAALLGRRRRKAKVAEEPDYVVPVEPYAVPRLSLDAQTAQLSAPCVSNAYQPLEMLQSDTTLSFHSTPFLDKDSSTMSSSNPTPSASTVTTTSVSTSQPRSSNIYPQSSSYAGTQDAALPQMIADLTHMLASIPIMRTLHEPPPQYEHEDGSGGLEREHATR